MDKKDFLSNNYLQVSKLDRQWGLYIISSGYSICGDKRCNPELYKGIHLCSAEHCFDCFNIVYIASGSMLFYPDPSLTKSITVSPGHIIILVPGEHHRYHANPSTGVKEYWIKFDGYYARNLQQHNILPQTTDLIKAGNPPAMSTLFQDIHGESEQEQSLSTQHELRPRLLALLSSLHCPRHHAANPIVEQAIAFMNATITANCDLSAFARKHGMSPHHFRKVFKATTGLPPLQYFLELKINKAKELLERKSHSVKEVAYSLGFEDQYYFSRLFSKKTGLTPSQWGK